MVANPPSNTPALWHNQAIILYHGTLNKHANSIITLGIDIEKSRNASDFGRGFYLTTLKYQAEAWADQSKDRISDPVERNAPENSPVIMAYQVRRDDLAKLDALWFIAVRRGKTLRFSAGMKAHAAHAFVSIRVKLSMSDTSQARKHMSEIRRTYKYRLYRCDRKDRKLRHKLFVASTIWNHFIALQRRCYRLTGKYISRHDMLRHVLKLRKTRRFSLWQGLHSQACQDVCGRVDDAYQRFFKGLAKGRPKFRQAKKYRSFTFPQSGYKVDGNRVTIDGTTYKFVKHRDLNGQIKTLTIKRDTVGRLWLVFSVVEELTIEKVSTGKSGGFDFGLKTFLTNDEGHAYSSPQFYMQGMRKTRQLSRQLSRKVPGSHRHKRAKRALAQHSSRVADQRRDHHFRLAHELCDEYDVLYFEDLNLQGLKALWGRKVSDLGFAQFMTILEWVAFKRGKQVVRIDRFAPTTKVCSGCGQKHNLTLRDRVLNCDCGLTIGRDHNAAINILCAGASAPYRSDSQTRTRLRSRADGRSSRL